jgi:hypothetical protein
LKATSWRKMIFSNQNPKTPPPRHDKIRTHSKICCLQRKVFPT